MKFPAQLLLLPFFIFLFSIFFSNTVFADCSFTSSVSPTSVDIGSSPNLTFRVDNSGTSDITQVEVTTQDNSLWSITNGSATGWSVTSDGGSQVVFSGGSLANDQGANFIVNASINSNVSDGTFFITVTTNSSATCANAFTVSAIDPSAIPLTISNVSISTNSTSATIAWTTSKSASSLLNYGTTNSYGYAKSDPNLATSHSITITSLSPSTTYHYLITNDDSYGNSASTIDESFSTSALNVTTTTVVKTISPTPTPTPLPDKNPPTVQVLAVLSKPFAKAPTISGSAKDDKGVAKVEYSLDGGKNFLPVSQFASAGKTSITFSFTPGALDDGNYDVVVRATDTNGNEGKSKISTLVIDRLPPQVSGLLFSFGPQVLSPVGGVVNALAAVPVNITLSAVGGPIEAKITAKNLITNEILNFPLVKNSESGLWRASIKFTKTGKYSLTYNAKDGAGNSANEVLNNVVVQNSGRISSSTGGVNKGKISIYYQEPTTHGWVLWDGLPYSQKNPVSVDESGNYNLFLPSGKYYLHIESDGFKSANSSFFELKQASIVNANFSLKPLKLLLALGPIKLYWPDFSAENVELKNSVEKNNLQQALMGKSIPYFKLDNVSSESLLGKPSIISFINTWNPASSEQIAVLNQISKNKNYNTIVIVEGEKVSKVNVWKKIGGYSLPVATDVDATLIPVYNLDSLPTSFFVDRKGVIKKITGGSLTLTEINKVLDSLNN